MRRRDFLASIAALVVSPALLLKKRKREADRQRVTFVGSDGCGGWSTACPDAPPVGRLEFSPDLWKTISDIQTTLDKQVGFSDVLLYGKSRA